MLFWCAADGTRYTACTTLRGRNGEYLDRQHLQCPHHQAMSRFKLTGHGCGGNQMRYTYRCEPVTYRGHVTRHTGCGILRGQKMEYLDRQNLWCHHGEVLTGFRLRGCPKLTDMQYVFTCAKVGIKSTYTKNAPCTVLVHKHAEYLDQQNVACNAGAFLTHFRLTGHGCTGVYRRYHFTCATTTVPSPGICHQNACMLLMFWSLHSQVARMVSVAGC